MPLQKETLESRHRNNAWGGGTRELEKLKSVQVLIERCASNALFAVFQLKETAEKLEDRNEQGKVQMAIQKLRHVHEDAMEAEYLVAFEVEYKEWVFEEAHRPRSEDSVDEAAGHPDRQPQSEDSVDEVPPPPNRPPPGLAVDVGTTGG